MLKTSYLIALLGLVFAVGGCPGGDDDDTGDDACTPGETQPCTCAGDESGAQECAPGGQGWGACDCGTGDDDDTTGDDDDDDTTGDDDDDDTTGDDDDDDTGDWVSIPGGTFLMGSTEGSSDEEPVHTVTVSSFQMWRTEVTVAQYGQCVDAVACEEPYEGSEPYANWGVAGREDHPVNYVDWYQAVAFCAWAGGRLPSESEWEYAARSGGQDITYPWGNEEATCDYAVMDDETHDNGCDTGRTWAVCGKSPAGDTDQGLCDMSGNVWEWVQDWYHVDYTGAPDDGSAWEDPSGSYRVLRGGSFAYYAVYLRAAYRSHGHPGHDYDNLGFRCARSN